VTALPRAARRVQATLHDLGVDAEVVELPDSTRTAPEAAAAVGCEVGAIVKALVFAGERPVLALVSGSNRADEDRLAAEAGGAVERATPDYVREHTGYAIGGVSPVGHPEPLTTLVDEDLLRHPVVWAAAGTPRCVFGIEPARLVEVTGGRVVRLAAAGG